MIHPPLKLSARSRSLLLGFAVLFVVTTYAKSKVATPYDSGYSIHLAISLLEHGDLDLEEYRDIVPEGDYRVLEVDGVLQSRYPVGPSVVAAPVVAMVESLGKYLFLVWDLDEFIKAKSPASIERFVGSVFTGLAALVIFYIARLHLPYGYALLVFFIAAFCTSAYSVTSRALWQHAPSLLFLSLALYLLLRARVDERMAAYSGLFVALAFAMRPTNALVVVALTFYVAVAHRASLWRYLAWASAVAIPFVAYHVSVFGGPLPWYYRQSSGKFSLDGSFLEAAAGTLISPGRGLFIYSPIFIFSILGAVVLWRQGRWRRLESTLAAILVLHWLAISSWKVWWGGTVFGPRLFADMIPFLIYFLLPVLELLRRRSSGWPVLAATLAVAALASTYIHRSGAREWATWDWNAEPTLIDEDPSRLWDWDDPPFLRRESESRPGAGQRPES